MTATMTRISTEQYPEPVGDVLWWAAILASALSLDWFVGCIIHMVWPVIRRVL